MSKRGDMIRTMHEKGFTYEEIGQLLGISKQAAHNAAVRIVKGFNATSVEKVKYTGLRNWMMSNQVSVSELSNRCGYAKMYASIVGESEPSKKYIDSILAVTGLTYEQCFKEEDKL